MDIGFAQNFTNLFEVDITPSGTDSTWARVAAGITSVSPEGNEEINQDAYYDGEGMKASTVDGGQEIIKFDGVRKYGDAAQDYVASLAFSYGEARKTKLRWTRPDGSVILGNVTLANIKTGGGDANNKNDFSFEAHFNGLPTVTTGEADTFPTEITCAAISVAVNASVSAAPTATPTGASQVFVYSIDDDTKATVESNGKVHGVAAGSCNLCIKSAVKPSVSVTAVVTVTA